MLQRLIDDLASGYWWFTVVLVGLAINLASAYIKNPLDRLIARASQERRRNIQLKEQRLQAHAERLAAYPTLLALEIRSEARWILLSVLLLAMASAVFAFAGWLSATLPAKEQTGKLLTVLLSTAALWLVVFSLSAFRSAMTHTDNLSYFRKHALEKVSNDA